MVDAVCAGDETGDKMISSVSDTSISLSPLSLGTLNLVTGDSLPISDVKE